MERTPISSEDIGGGKLSGGAIEGVTRAALSQSSGFSRAQSRSHSTARNAWLDALRAAAVISVVTFHVVQMSPLQGSAVSKVTYYGQFGVDLFFVLSGWLIGTLFWRELNQSGRVSIGRFWARRALRTIPPYLVALALSWIAVAVYRKEQFDPGYLMFVQNYYKTIPFFLVSWSLCIEEHFYLVIPLAAALVARLAGKAALPWALLTLILISPLARTIEFRPNLPDDLGYALTATHLRLDGIALGFWASFAAIRWPEKFAAVASSLGLRIAAASALAVILVIEVLGKEQLRYVLLPSALALLFTCFVIARPINVGAWAFGGLQGVVVRWIALRSYSAYLTHALAIHLTLLATGGLMGASLLYWPVVFAAILTGTVAFYFLVESRAIKFRDAWVAR